LYLSGAYCCDFENQQIMLGLNTHLQFRGKADFEVKLAISFNAEPNSQEMEHK
jgi:hypothetical protein